MGDARPHVVHVLDSLQVGGTEHGVANLICATGAGLRHTVVTMTEGGPVAARLPADVAVHTVGKRPGLDLRAVGRLARLLRRLAPDVVHSRNWGTLDAVPAARLARVGAVVHGEHGREASDPQGLSSRRNRLRRWLGPLVDRFVTVSFDLAGWLETTVGLPPRKIVTIHNGVDLRRFTDEAPAPARGLLGLPAEGVVIGAVGRLDPVKDHLGLLDACAALGGDRDDWTLVLVGEGPCRAALEARAARSDLAGRIRLLGARSDVPDLLRAFDLFVLPSIAEGISNTVLEAMATGLPVIATRTGGNPELVEDGVTGALVPVGDRAALARALRAQLADAHLRRLQGKAGRQRAAAEFSLERMAGRYAELYRALAGPGHGRARR